MANPLAAIGRAAQMGIGPQQMVSNVQTSAIQRNQDRRAALSHQMDMQSAQNELRMQENQLRQEEQLMQMRERPVTRQYLEDSFGGHPEVQYLLQQFSGWGGFNQGAAGEYTTMGQLEEFATFLGTPAGMPMLDEYQRVGLENMGTLLAGLQQALQAATKPEEKQAIMMQISQLMAQREGAANMYNQFSDQWGAYQQQQQRAAGGGGSGARVPTTREIDGRTMQWDDQNGRWVEPTQNNSRGPLPPMDIPVAPNRNITTGESQNVQTAPSIDTSALVDEETARAAQAQGGSAVELVPTDDGRYAVFFNGEQVNVDLETDMRPER